MAQFKRGDAVTVTKPVQPTGHKVGDTGVVVDVGTVGGSEIVQIQQDSDGSLVGVHPEEITKR